MNIQSLIRKRELGIDNVNDYGDWARTYVYSKTHPLERSADSMVVHKLAHIDSSRIEILDSEAKHCELARELFLKSVGYLQINLPAQAENSSAEADVIRSIYFQSRTLEKDLFAIDIRKLSDFQNSTNSWSSLDSIAEVCSCRPLGEYWVEFDLEASSQLLKRFFAFEPSSIARRVMSDTQAHELARQFHSLFTSPIEIYSNYVPESMVGVKGGDPFLLSSYDYTFTVIVRDRTHIGMVVSVGYLC